VWDREWKELKRLCKQVGIIPPPEIFVNISLFGKDQKLKFAVDGRANSWARNYYNIAFGITACGITYGTTFEAGAMTAKRTNGTINNYSTYSASRSGFTLLGYGICNNGANANYGIVIGSADDAFSAEQYALASLIAHGTGGGQMSYAAQAAPTLNYDAGTDVWSSAHSRTITNNSGGDITVKETGLYWSGYAYTTSSTYQMIERTVLGTPVTVGNTENIVVTYTLYMDFSAIDS
jgi:hypothetical protein